MADLELKAWLQEARGLVAKGWTQNVFARDAEGRITNPAAPNACCWCAVGALDRVAVLNCIPVYDRRNLTTLLRSFVDEYGITRWNDDPSRTQEEVLALFDKAIAALAEAKE